MLLSIVTAALAPPAAPEPSTSVVTLVVLVDVMLSVPVPLPALTVEPPPTWATAEELTIEVGDRRVGRVAGRRCCPTVCGGVDRGAGDRPDRDVPAGPVDRDVVEDPPTVTVALGSRSAIAAATPDALRAPPRRALFV